MIFLSEGIRFRISRSSLTSPMPVVVLAIFNYLSAMEEIISGFVAIPSVMNDCAVVLLQPNTGKGTKKKNSCGYHKDVLTRRVSLSDLN